MHDKYKTTFPRSHDGTVLVARIWDIYRQQWRTFRDYGDVPLRVLASLPASERNMIHARLPHASEYRPFE